MAKNSGLAKAFQAVKNYFDLGFHPEESSNDKFNFVIEGKVAKPATVGAHLKHYFDLHSAYRPSHQVMRDVLSLVDGAEGTQKVTMKAQEKGFVLIECDADFAEKIRKLPSVTAVREVAPKEEPKAPPAPAA